MEAIIKTPINNLFTFTAYKALFEELVSQGKTTGPNQSDGYVSYTKLNLSRYNRATKQYKISNEAINQLKEIDTPVQLIVITEAWCGDASQVLPVLEAIENSNNNIDIKLVLRDENEALMNSFLTNGSKSIPKVIIMDKNNEVIDSWGPRPSVLQNDVIQFKQDYPEATSMDVSNLVQKWYNEDKGISIEKELLALILKSCCIS